jgi:hypothetical protein
MNPPARLDLEPESSIERALSSLAQLSEELSACIFEFRNEKKCGQIDLNFSQGDLASVEIVERFDPASEVGSSATGRCARFAARKVQWFIHAKRSGRVSLVFDSGDIASVKSFIRLSPGRKKTHLEA